MVRRRWQGTRKYNERLMIITNILIFQAKLFHKDHFSSRIRQSGAKLNTK